jgi:hypothetical protein
MKYCFLDIRRACESDCMAFCGSEDEAACLLLHVAASLERIVPKENTITYPISAPPPEVT